MLKVLLLSMIMSIASEKAFAEDNQKISPFSNHENNQRRESQETLFRCAAGYGIWMKISEEKNEAEQVELYRAKYDKLSKDAENSFQIIGENKMEVETHLQKHVDNLVKLAATDGRVLPGVRAFCDKEFP